MASGLDKVCAKIDILDYRHYIQWMLTAIAGKLGFGLFAESN